MSDVKFITGCIYKPDEPYDDSNPKYDHYMSDVTGEYGIGDCWVCDSTGNIHPGYNCCPVPIHVDSLGEIVGHISNKGDY